MATANPPTEDSRNEGERIAKVIARSGFCSRREAEVLITEKRVSVNGTIIDSAALNVSASDTILVDGKPISSREPPRLWRYYKPKGRVTTHKDPEGRPTVFESLPDGLPRLISVGRLDFNTEGLLLLTNDGDLARHLELPSTGWTRRYRVRAHGQATQEQLDSLAAGLAIGKMNYGSIDATLEREQGGNVWISLAIREGKNREVRRIMEHLGLTVNRLIRVSFGPFMLGELEPGQIEEVKTAVLKDQLGPRLSRQLGVRREPMREERKLPPARAKPTYLRRQPAPARAILSGRQEARPLKRRRILSMDGKETPKLEYVQQPRTKSGQRREEDRGGQDRRHNRGDDRRRHDRSAEESRHSEDGQRTRRHSGDRGELYSTKEKRFETGRGDGFKPQRTQFNRSTSKDGDRPPKRDERAGSRHQKVRTDDRGRSSFGKRTTGEGGRGFYSAERKTTGQRTGKPHHTKEGYRGRQAPAPGLDDDGQRNYQGKPTGGHQKVRTGARGRSSFGDRTLGEGQRRFHSADRTNAASPRSQKPYHTRERNRTSPEGGASSRDDVQRGYQGKAGGGQKRRFGPGQKHTRPQGSRRPFSKEDKDT
ncbi:MAG: pseudouridine synthase [Rhodomicrobium sp.]